MSTGAEPGPMPLGSSRGRELFFCGLLAAGFFVVRIVLGKVGSALLVDDAYITLRYVRNLLDTGDFVYNPGDWVFGITTVLYPILLALFSILSTIDDLTVCVQIVNVILEIGCFLLVFRILEAHVGRPILSTGLSLVAVSAASFLISSQSGMETPLFCLCLLAVAVSVEKRILLAAVFAGMAFFVRPEGVIAMGIVAGLSLLTGKAKLTWPVLALFALSYVLFMYIGYGAIVPASVTVKSAFPAPPEFYHASLYLARSLWSLIPVGAVPEVVRMAIFLGFSAVGIIRWPRKGHQYFFLLAFPGLYWVLYSLGNPHMWYWYTTPFVFIVSLFFVYGLYVSSTAILKKHAQVGIGFVCAVLVLLGAWYTFRPQGAILDLYTKRVGAYREVVETLRAEHGLNAEDSILTHEIGAIGYYAGSKIIDAAGLINPDLAPLGIIEQDGKTVFGKCTAVLLEASTPDFILFQEHAFERGLRESEAFQHTYTLLFEKEGSAYGKDSGELLVYRRK